MEKRVLIAAGGVVSNAAGQIMLIFRRGYWDLPKGKQDPGESIEACALREVQEETGMAQLQLGTFLCITRHEYFDPYLNEDVIKESHWYTMRIPDQQAGLPQTSEDITEIRWVALNELGTYLTQTYPNIREVLNQFLNDAAY